MSWHLMLTVEKMTLTYGPSTAEQVLITCKFSITAPSSSVSQPAWSMQDSPSRDGKNL